MEQEDAHKLRRRLTWVLRMPNESAQDPNNWPPKSNVKFDWTIPTNEAYATKETITVVNEDEEQDDDNDLQEQLLLHFASTFRQARAKLDYSYHKNPADKRQELQDAILRRIVDNSQNTSTSTSTKPRIVFTSGAMGVGKGYVLSTLTSVGLFPSEEYIKIDPDMLKYELPEFAGYLEKGDPALAATQLHRESTQMADVLFEYALGRKLPLLVDGSLKDVEWYKQLFDRLALKEGYDIIILWVTASSNTIHERALKRAEITGRSVPTALINESIQQVPKSVSILSQKPYTTTFEIVNEDDTPLQLYRHGSTSMTNDDNNNADNDFEQDKEEMDWIEFGKFWNQYRPKDGQDDAESSLSWSPPVDWCSMKDSNDNNDIHVAAHAIWGAAYSKFCSQCALICDSQCGVCIHGKHLCCCEPCKTKEQQSLKQHQRDSKEGKEQDGGVEATTSETTIEEEP